MLAETRDDAFMSELTSVTASGLSPALESLRHSVQRLVQLRGGARLLVARLSSLSLLSRLGQLTLGAGAGLLCWWLITRQGQATNRAQPLQPLRKKRVRQSSTSTWQLTSDSASVSGVSRPSYNWAELQRASVSDQDSVVSGATLVDGTQLAPQQLGLMGMEALETVIR